MAVDMERLEPRRPGWGDIVKSALALHLARAAHRVNARRRTTADAGRMGGERVAHLAAGPPTPGVRGLERGEEAAGKTPAPSVEAAPLPRNNLEIARFVFQEFGRDNGTLMAASVAFYLLLSIIPLILVAVFILGEVLGRSNRGVDQVFLFLDQLMPIQKNEIHRMIKAVIDARGSIGVAGFAGIALTATGGFATLENAINVLWNRPNRGFLMNKLFAFGMMVVVGALFALSVGVTSAVGWAGRIPGMEWVAHSVTLQILGYVVPLLVTGLMFTLIYRFYPNGRSHWRPAMISGFITAALWEAFKVGYTFYLSHGDQSIYATVVGLVMWIFYSSSLVLLGSELNWVLEGCPGREAKEIAQVQRGR